MLDVIEAIINGLLLGGVYALVAVSLNLIFGVMRLINLAHGDVVMIGMYIVFWIFLWFKDIYLATFVAIIILMMIMVVLQKVVFNPLLKAPAFNQLVATGGLIFALQYGAQLVWSADYRTVPIGFPIIKLGGVFISLSRAISFTIAMIAILLLHIFLQKTYLGAAIRATVQDSEGAQLMGINPRRIYIATAIIEGILIGVASSCLSLIYSVYPQAGTEFTLLAFIIVVLGGLGSLLGSFIGAFIIGEVITISAVFTSLEWSFVITLIVFIIIIIVRPYGLLGKRV